MVYTMTSERMCVLACAAGIACAVPNTARGIPVSGPPVQYEQSYCVKVRVCGGYANGQCKAMGVVCKSGSCEPDGARPDYCSWTYVFDCEGPALTTCVLIVLSESVPIAGWAVDGSPTTCARASVRIWERASSHRTTRSAKPLPRPLGRDFTSFAGRTRSGFLADFKSTWFSSGISP